MAWMSPSPISFLKMRISSRVPWKLSLPPALLPNTRLMALVAATAALDELATCTPFTYRSINWKPPEFTTAATWVQAPSVRAAGLVTVTPPMVKAMALPERRKYQPFDPEDHLLMRKAVDPLAAQSGLTQNI